jgi:hypothetical protein
LLAREYGEFEMPPNHKFTVDAYAAQHPGQDESRSRQSIGVHLIRLCLMLERDAPADYATRIMSRATNGSLGFPWFDPVTPIGTVTVSDVLAASDFAEHSRLVREWADDIWSAWTERHETVRRWVDRLEAQLPDFE